MKVKTSVSLSQEVLCKIDEAVGKGGNRSEFLERLARRHFQRLEREERGRKDIAIYARLAHDPQYQREVEETRRLAVPWWELGDEVETLEKG